MRDLWFLLCIQSGIYSVKPWLDCCAIMRISDQYRWQPLILVTLIVCCFTAGDCMDKFYCFFFQFDFTVILEQPHSVNTTVGSTAIFFIVTSSQCKFAFVTIWQPNGEEMEEIVDISGSLSTHQNITYEIREVSLNESRLYVMFTALPPVGDSVNSSTALMLVQGKSLFERKLYSLDVFFLF